jgi:NAD(P)-dependent dehydrogenase (short-subunit alcohol dehydrogenase family)
MNCVNPTQPNNEKIMYCFAKQEAAELEITAGAITANGGPKAMCVSMDLGERGVLASLVKEVGERHPNLFTLINNAGVMYPEPVTGADPERSYEMFMINVLAPMEGCSAAVQVMRRQGTSGKSYSSLSHQSVHTAWNCYRHTGKNAKISAAPVIFEQTLSHQPAPACESKFDWR